MVHAKCTSIRNEKCTHIHIMDRTSSKINTIRKVLPRYTFKVLRNKQTEKNTWFFFNYYNCNCNSYLY